MNITKVSYGKTYSLGNYCSERIDLEASIDETNESVTDAVFQLREYCDQLHKKNNPHLYKDQETMAEQEPVVIWGEPLRKSEQTKLSQKELIISEINKCQSQKQLKEWNLLASKYPETKELYDLKLKQLS